MIALSIPGYFSIPASVGPALIPLLVGVEHVRQYAFGNGAVSREEDFADVEELDHLAVVKRGEGSVGLLDLGALRRVNGSARENGQQQ